MVVKYSNNKVLSFCLTMQSCTGDLNLDVSKKVLISVKKSLKYKHQFPTNRFLYYIRLLSQK